MNINIGLLLVEATILFIFTFIYCTLKISKEVSIEEDEQTDN